MNRLRDSGANQTYFPQKIIAAAPAALAALTATAIQPAVSSPFSKCPVASFQHHQAKNNCSTNNNIYTIATIKITTAAIGCPSNRAIMANKVPKNALSESTVVPLSKGSY